MRILIVGAGAVGGYYGALLLQAGRDVTFLVRPARAAQLRSGLRLVGPDAVATLQPRTVVAGGVDGPYDVVVVAVKAYGLDDAIADLAPAVGPATMIVPLLNGMRHVDVLVARFGEEPVLGGVSSVSATLDADGAVRNFSSFPAPMVYGERVGDRSSRIDALHAVMHDAGFTASASPDIVRAMWRKWTTLASLGSINTLMRGSVGEVEAAGGAPVATRLYDETVAVATAYGYGPADVEAGEMRTFLTGRGSPVTSSLYRDLTAGYRTEAEHIVGDLVARARARDVATPLLDAALAAMRVYELRRSA